MSPQPSQAKRSQAIIKAHKSLHSPTKVMGALLLWLKPNSSAKRKLHSHDIIFSTRKLSYNVKVALHPTSQRQKSKSIGQAQANHVAKQKSQSRPKQKGKRAHKRPIRQAVSKKTNEHTSDPSCKQQAKRQTSTQMTGQSSYMQNQIRRGWLIV